MKHPDPSAAPRRRPRLPRYRAGLLALVSAIALVALGCVEIATPTGWPAPAVTNDGLVLVQVQPGQLSAVDPDTGRAVWRFPDDVQLRAADRNSRTEVGPLYATPIVDGGTIYLVSHEGQVIRIDQDGQRLESPWYLHLGEPVVATPILDGDRLYIATERGNVHIVDAARGQVLQRHRASSGRIWGQPALGGDVLYLADLDEKRTVALDVTTGERLWEQGLTAASAADLILDRDLLIVGSFDRALHALDTRAGGEERWRFRGDAWFVGPPATNGDVRYAASLGGSVYAIGPDGQEIWRQGFEDHEFRATPLLVNGVLVVASRHGLLAGLDPENGDVLWERFLEGVRVNAHGRLLESDIFYLTTDHELLRVDPATGSVQRFPVAG